MTDTSRRPSSGVEGAAITPAARERLLTGVLRGVSRSFYLTLRVLPRELREPVGLAYLLARAADTISDTRPVPPVDRLQHLVAFREQVAGPADMSKLRQIGLTIADTPMTSDEHSLLLCLPDAISVLETSPEDDRTRIRSLVVTLTRGMELDLTRFPAEDSGQVSALKDAPELDEYTYYVAGCVGEFWTAMTVAHTPSLSGWDAHLMSELGVRFGKALQLTNVLRDLPRDLRMGRCYLPRTELDGVGMAPKELLDPALSARARPLLAMNILTALEHYNAAEEYILAIPHRCMRLRLAAIWPVLIGLTTLAKLARSEVWLDPSKPSKVSRGCVYRMMALSVPCAASNVLLQAWMGSLQRRVQRAL